MKNILLIALALFAFSCSGQLGVMKESGQLGQDYEMNTGQKIVFLSGSNAKSTEEPVELIIDEFADSFCPPDAQCIRWGEAWALLRLKKGNASEDFGLCIGDCPGYGDGRAVAADTTDNTTDFKLVELEGQEYKVSMLGVNRDEYPESYGIFKVERVK